jgi:hypothetical protein
VDASYGELRIQRSKDEDREEMYDAINYVGCIMQCGFIAKVTD